MSAIRSILEGKSPRVLKIGTHANVLHAVRTMCAHRIGALLVETENRVVGILSERDILMRVLLAQHDPSTTTVADVMTRNPVCIDVESDAEEAMKVMTERRVRHLPVMENDALVGIVSIGDLVRWASTRQEYEIRTLTEYVAGVYS